MEESINYRIDENRIGMIKVSPGTIEFMMITRNQSWETSMKVTQFIDALEDDYSVPVKDVMATLTDMVNYKGFVIGDDNVLTLYLKHRINAHVKFPSFAEPCMIPSFLWSAVIKDATERADTREREERIRLEEERVAATVARQQLLEKYMRWKKKNPTALVSSVPEQFAPLFT
jgi:hypothetical protein